MATRQEIGIGLQAFGEGVGGRGQQFIKQLDERRKGALLQDALRIEDSLGRGDIGQARELLLNRIDAINQLAGDPSDTVGLLQKLDAGDVRGALTDVSTVVSFAQDEGLLPRRAAPERKIVNGQLVSIDPITGEATATDIEGFERDPTKKALGTASQRDFETFLKLKDKASETQDPRDIEKANQFGRQSGFIRETEEEKADISVDKTTRQEIAKANVKRRQGFIDAGIDAADGAANLRRIVTLLDTVKTGGFNNFQLRAKQLFGVEGADELELSTSMGKNVLAQLKPIFGAAFTAKEGEELKRIESGFGRSTEGNKRLVKRALKLVDRAARRGIAAAADQGDTFTADEIRSALEFTLDEPRETIPAGNGVSALTDEEIKAQLGL